jgi:hypothetical protein
MNSHILNVVTVLVACGGLLSPSPGAGQTATPRVGVYFDEQGNACSANLEPFDPVGVQAHILAFVEPGTELAGALFRLELPSEIQIVNGTVEWPKNSTVTGSMTSTTGTDLQLQICPTSDGTPVRLVSFVLNDIRPGMDPRPDLEIKVAGGTIAADTLTLKEPNLKLCDPDQPDGYADLIVAPTTLATLNCSSGNCPCEVTAVQRRTWTAVRKLYADD